MAEAKFYRLNLRMSEVLTALTFISTLLTSPVFAQEANSISLLEYKPAPGQFINLPSSGTPGAASAICTSTDHLLSLGAFGGYVVYAFEHPVENDPANPYGIDFTIFGNPLTDAEGAVRWAEPGIVYVMKDENGNGIPDETWYEIAGSESFFSGTQVNFDLLYRNPGGILALDVPWTASNGETGFIKALDFYTQPYYPSSGYFPAIDPLELQFSGRRLSPLVYLNEQGEMVCRSRAFGYADNHQVKSMSSTYPDNPYTAEIEGCGGDAIDIGWAVDEQGRYVELDRIDFVKVATGVQEDGRWLGELSTEVRYIRDEAPLGAQEFENEVLIINELPPYLVTGSVLHPEAMVFRSGKIQADETIDWELSGPAASYFSGEQLVTGGTGLLTLKAGCTSNSILTSSISINLVEAVSLEIDPQDLVLRNGEQTEVTAHLLDTYGRELSGSIIIWSSSDTSVLSLTSNGTSAILNARKAGRVYLKAKAVNTTLESGEYVTVTTAPEEAKVWFGSSLESACLLTGRHLPVDNFDLRPYIDGSTDGYAPDNIDGISLAHVIASSFDNIAFESDLRFRTDEKGLYLWKFPDIREGYTEYYYGAAPASAAEDGLPVWLVMINGITVSSGLDKVAVKDDDEVWLFRLEDASSSWTFEHLKTDNYTYNSGDYCRLSIQAYQGSISGDGSVAVSASWPVSGAGIDMQSPETKSISQAAITDEYGEALIPLSEKGEVIFSCGVTRKMVTVGIFTGTLPGNELQACFAGPNPFNNEIRFILTGNPAGRLTLYDVNGRIVKQQSLNGLEEFTLETGDLKAGLYLYRIESEALIFTGKLIKSTHEF